MSQGSVKKLNFLISLVLERRQWNYECPFIQPTMAKGSRTTASALILIMLASTCFVAPSQANSEILDEIEILHTAVNPDNNKTYHLLSASSWEDAAFKARSLDGYLTTIDDADENTWVYDTFADFDNQSRHLWIGLNDVQDEGMYRWHDGTPFLYRNWGADQPTGGEDSDYVHIASTNMGNIMPQTWNDLENNPEYFPVYGVVEIGPGADFSLRFDGHSDHIVIDHDAGLMPNGSLSIEATIKTTHLEGIQFITMKGDYGWGMYLTDGYIGYASEYSLSKHPTSNSSIDEDSWYTIGVKITEGVGGQFTIDGEPAGNISAEDASIPNGDFGSNDCFTSGDACDELYIGRMGAGCDCYHFTGIIDEVLIAQREDGVWTPMSSWTFWEGEGGNTGDALNNDTMDRVGIIEGADWVMPDGSVVAQAIELPNHEYVFIEDIQEGDTLLFYAELGDFTIMADIYMWAWAGEHEGDHDYYYDEELPFEAYVGYDRIPAPWDSDLELSNSYYGYIYEDWVWPEADVLWFSVVATTDIEEFEIIASWEEGEAPPSIDEMIELNNGVAITSQSMYVERGEYEATLEYYYVNVTDALTELKIQTYGGKGNVDLVVSHTAPINPNYGYYYGYYGGSPYYEYEYYYDDMDYNTHHNDDAPYDTELSNTWSTRRGNNEDINLYDVQPGIYYITAYTYDKATDFTIIADFTYAPINADPSTAIELQPGVAYGPLSGYNGLNQYFFIDVPTDTERLEVQLANGIGEAKLRLRYENTPTVSESDHHSGAQGANDKIGFNNPTPGKWYILLDSRSVFSGVEITASFTDLYVWSYDGTPLQLFNDEPIEGLDAPAGEEMYFYVDLTDENVDFLRIETYGGQGSLKIGAQSSQIYGTPNSGAIIIDDDFDEIGYSAVWDECEWDEDEGEYLCWMKDYDEYSEEMIEEMMEYLEYCEQSDYGCETEPYCEEDTRSDVWYCIYDSEFSDGEGSSYEFTSYDIYSYGQGTSQDLEIYLYYYDEAGRIDITVFAENDFSDVTIVAVWDEYDDYDDEDEDDWYDDTDEFFECDRDLEDMFASADNNDDGFIDFMELFDDGGDEEILKEVDQNGDLLIEYGEMLAYFCTCESELWIVEYTMGSTIKTESFDLLPLKNEFSSDVIDLDNDGVLTDDEIEEHQENCKTTFNPMDRDNDGVLNDNDKFPDDENEQEDADGDGIGDNADFAPSVANDIVYGAGGAMLIVLIGLLILFLRSGSNSRQRLDDEWNKQDAFAEHMLQLNMDAPETPASVPQAPGLSPNDTEIPSYQQSEIPIYDFGGADFDLNQDEQPPSNLMGMMDANGREHIEYPSNSGKLWHRDNPDAPWTKD